MAPRSLIAIAGLVAAFSAGGPPASLVAQGIEGWRVFVNPYVGAFVFDDSELNDIGREVNIGPLLGVRGTVPLTPVWWVEAAYGLAWMTVEPSEFQDDTEDIERDLAQHLLYAAAGYRIGSDELPTRLLLSAGAGISVLSPEGGDTAAHFMIPLGVGFTHPVNDWITFRGDAVDHIVFCTAQSGDDFSACLDDEALNHIQLSGGLQFRVR